MARVALALMAVEHDARLIRLAWQFVHLILVLTLADSVNAQDTGPRISPITVSTARIKISESFQRSRTFYGSIQPHRASPLVFSRSGLIKSVAVEDGEVVKAGDLIATLDSQELQEQRKQVVRALTALGPIASLDVAQDSQRRQLQMEIAALDRSIEGSFLKAPIEGVAELQQLQEKTMVLTGMPVGRVLDISKLNSVHSVPDSVVRELEEGNTYSIVSGGISLQATLESIQPELKQEAATRTLVFLISESATTEIAPGRESRFVFSDSVDGSGTWVPITALTRKASGAWNVYVLDPSEDDEAIVVGREVKIIYFDQTRARVQGKIRDGEEIIPSGLHRVVPGQTVVRFAEASEDDS